MITSAEQLKNTKIRVNSPDESKKIQEKAFELGYRWASEGQNIVYTDSSYLYFDYNRYISYYSALYFFEDCSYKEITLSDLFHK